MGNLLDSVGALIINNYQWRHLLIILGIFIQGETTVFISIYLILNKYLGWGGFFIAAAAGLLTYDWLLFTIGRLLRSTNLGDRLEKKVPNYAKIQFGLQKRAVLFLIISKFVAYLNTIVVVLSGWNRMPWADFFKSRVIANAVWLFITVSVSLFMASGITLLGVKKVLGVEIAVIAVILATIFGIKHILKKLLEKEAAVEEKAELIGKKF